MSKEGKLAVANPLTRKMRILPDTQVTSKLNLHQCLKGRVWSWRTATPSIHLSVQTVVDNGGEKTFKVTVWGELRTRQIHLLVYSSATDSWSTQLCSDVDHRFFKSPFFNVDGHTIYVTSPYRSRPMVARYDTDTGLFVVNQRRTLQFREWFRRIVVERVQIIGTIAYRSQILLLAGIVGEYKGIPLALVALWQQDTTGLQWQLFTAKRLRYPTLEIAAAYDGNSSVTIIQNMICVMTLNLESREWNMTFSNPASVGGTRGDPVLAYHMKLKLCTAL